MKDPAPLFTHCYDLAAWILAHFDGRQRVLAQALCTHSLALLDAVALALRGVDREEQLATADEVLVELRLRLRLAHQTGLLDERQMLYALEQADQIGRQIGGWRKRL